MWQTIRENRSSITISFIIAIIIFYLQPILDYIGTGIVKIILGISSKFSRYIYQLAAQNDPNLISDYVTSLIFFLFVWIVMGEFIEIWQGMRKLEEKTAEFKGKLSGAHAGANEKELTIEEELTKIETSMRKDKFKLKLISSVGVIVFLSILSKQGINSAVNSMNVSFQNELTVLSVHLSDTDIKKLRANWVQMKSADDYRKIISEIADCHKKFDAKQ